MPHAYIMVVQPEDQTVMDAANNLRQKFPGNCDVVSMLDGAWPGMEPGSTAYLVAHASPLSFAGSRNPSAFLDQRLSAGDLRSLLVNSGKVVLVSCSSGGQPLSDKGVFAVKNWAQNFQTEVRKPVDAAVGPVDPDTFDVSYDFNAYTAGSKDGWFRWDGARGPQEGDPFTLEGQ